MWGLRGCGLVVGTVMVVSFLGERLVGLWLLFDAVHLFTSL